MSVSVQKRLLELELYGERNSRRAYVVGDVDLLRSLTVSLFLISVLVFNLYLVFELKVIDYKYFVILNYALLYFCFEFFADRSSDDPVKLLLKHPKLILIGLVLLLLVLFMK